MTPTERQQVQARLAAGDVASLKDQEIIGNPAQMNQDEMTAIQRIMQNMNVSQGVAQIQLRQLIRHLQNSALTINFNVTRFIKYPPPKGLKNVHELGSNDPNNLNRRLNVEQHLFQYYTINRPGPQNIIDRINQFGSHISNPTFEPSMRPKYGALNYTSNPRGPARTYGDSYMELKEHVKHKCTYTAGDSFEYELDPNAAIKVATFHNLERIIANMEDNPLWWLLHKALAMPKSPHLAVGKYVEAQIHTEVLFSRDVKKLCISRGELEKLKHPKVARQSVELFARQNGIMLEFII